MAKKKGGKFLTSLVFISLLVIGAGYIYKKFFFKINLKDKNYTYIYIETNDSFDDVISDINAEQIIDEPEAFVWLAKKMKLNENIHPGRYRITDGMTPRQIINLIKYNKQEKVKLFYNSQIHNLDEFVEYTDEKLHLSAGELEDFLTDENKLEQHFKLNPDNAFALVSPGIYELSWAISADDFFEELKKVYQSKWKGRRTALAKNAGFTIPEIITLASIVQSESNIRSEQEKIAGVYINRLNKNMLLQADPTLKFANKNFDVQRVLDADKQINSPYNTYRYKGLPPGPICLVSTQAIDATLNYARHKYIFFCAKPQLNGYSDYSVNYEQHQKHANAYKKALDKRGIIR